MLSNLARLLERMEKCVEARSIMQQAIDLLASDAADETSRRLLLFARGHAAGLDSKMGSCQRALRDMRDVHRGITEAFGANHPATTTSAIKLAGLCIEAGKPQDAIDLLDELPTREESIRLHARALADQGALEAAAELIATLKQTPDPKLLHARLLLDAGHSAGASAVVSTIDRGELSDLQRFELGELLALMDGAEVGSLETAARRAYGEDSPAMRFASVLRVSSRGDTPAGVIESATKLASLADQLAEECGEYHRWTVEAKIRHAQAQKVPGDAAAARELLAPILSWSVSEHGPDHPMTRKIRRALDG